MSSATAATTADSGVIADLAARAWGAAAMEHSSTSMTGAAAAASGKVGGEIRSQQAGDAGLVAALGA